MPPFVHSRPIRFAEVDPAGIVYYPRYLDFCHQAFEELWAARRGPRAYIELLERERLGLPTVHVEADYRQPSRFGDRIDIAISLVRLGTSSATLRYRISIEHEPTAIVAEITTVIVCVNMEGFAPVPMPAEIRALWTELA